MDMCSKKAYLKRRAVNHVLENEVDTNVVQVKFDTLKAMVAQIHQGDPIQCGNCEIVLNKHSLLTQDVQNEQFQNKQIWICEFCNHSNAISVEKEEIPMAEDVVYLVQSAQEAQQLKQDVNVDQTLIFCIDNSGSMSSTSEIKGKVNFKHGISAEEYEMLKQFIEPGDELQQMPQWNKNITHISRKQCVLAAIEQQISEIKQTQPNKLVGLVTFNNEVVIVGDGTEQPQSITGDRLFKADEIREQTKAIAGGLLSKTIKDSADSLIKKFEKIQEKGQTALGPALLASLELAKLGKPGSQVIICTDGLANLGLGSMDGNQDAAGFYADLATFAVENGITISVVTIKGEGCKMETLSQMVEKTNGTVTRVQPDQIGNDFANILKDEVVGTKVELTIKLHRALRFRNEEDPNLTTTLVKDLGNVTINTIVTFEYQAKTEQELTKENIQLNDIKKVPFQIKIQYTSLNGDKYLRVMTQYIDTTQELHEAEREAKVEIIHKRMGQRTAMYADKADYHEAKQYNRNWDNYVQTNEAMNMDKGNQEKNINFRARNEQLNKVVERKSKRSEKQEPQIKKVEGGGGFLEKLGSMFGSNQAPQPMKQEVKQAVTMKECRDISPVQQQKQEKRRMSVQSESESDEDMEIAELKNFKQSKY